MALGVLVIRLEGATGILPDTHSPPFAGNGGGASLWQVVFPLALGARSARWRRRRVPGDADSAGAGRYLGAHAALLVGAGLAFAGNAYLLVLVLPALHIWLLLPDHGAPGRRGARSRRAGGLARTCRRDRTAGRRGRFRGRRAGVVRPPHRRRRIPVAASLALAVLASATIECCG